MLAERSGRSDEPQQHFLAAAHLELVLASDYEQAGDEQLARRSRISAASCFWRAGKQDLAQSIFDGLMQQDPGTANEVRQLIDELAGSAS